MKNWYARFFELKTIIHELIFMGNKLYPESIKTDNGAVANDNFFVRQERNQKLHQF